MDNNLQTEKKSGFAKEKVLKFKRYENRLDLLQVLLKENQAYTLAEVDALIEKFMKKEVN